MALTVSEAIDVNTLLDWILGIRRPGSIMTDDELAAEAQAAAGRLADKANKTLMAGLDMRRVNEAWQHVQVGPWIEGDNTRPCQGGEQP